MRARRAWTRISPGELTSRIADEGLGRIARRLATTPDVLLAAMRGACRLSPIRVIALRDGVDLEPLIDAWVERRVPETEVAHV